MIYLNLAFEDDLSESVMKRIVNQFGGKEK